MRAKPILERWGLTGGWAREIVLAGLALVLGFGIMPALIFLAGSLALGRYEGAGVARIYQGLYQGLGSGSLASWVVALGPYALYLLFKFLRLWWRASVRLA
ncbi:MAG: hypothetical protein JWN43_2039 [Gammaproteobacteria bacterium]|nr:hypothetical protein [Gammaproteobacteria bacterium]